MSAYICNRSCLGLPNNRKYYTAIKAILQFKFIAFFTLFPTKMLYVKLEKVFQFSPSIALNNRNYSLLIFSKT